ncbi:DUF2202 domain-containing protein [Calditrichota bacterium LG25]
MYRLKLQPGLVLSVLFVAILFVVSTANAQNRPGAINRPCFRLENILNMPVDSLSQSELNGLIFMREEEKLARDVYIVLYQAWGQRIFNNISRSEQTHMDAIKILLKKYKVSDPVTTDSVGVFTNQTLQKLFNELTARGKTSLAEALKVGALIEEIDILDLQKELQEIKGNDDLRYVYENLKRGSENHLRAFVRNLQRLGIKYSPVKLSTKEFTAIITSNF